MPNTKCPLPGDHEHELLESKKGVPYVRCDRFGTNVFFKSATARSWLTNQNDGHTARENPIYSLENPRQVIESEGVAEPNEGESDDTDAEPHPLALRCSKCGVPIRAHGMEACSSCGEPILWEE